MTQKKPLKSSEPMTVNSAPLTLDQLNLQLMAEDRELRSIYTAYLKAKYAFDLLNYQGMHHSLKARMNEPGKPEPKTVPAETF